MRIPIFLSIFLLVFSCDKGISEVTQYNHYKRTYFGDFELLKLDVDNIEGFHLLKYEAIKENGQVTKVKGYYYTGELKFEDIIKEKNIVKTTYFTPGGKVLLLKEYTRLKNELQISLKMWEPNAEGIKMFFVENFKVSGGQIEYNRDYKDNDLIFFEIRKSQGILNTSYKPLNIRTEIWRTNNPEKVIIAESIYSYDSKGNKTSFNLKQNGVSVKKISYYYDAKGIVKSQEEEDFFRKRKDTIVFIPDGCKQNPDSIVEERPQMAFYIRENQENKTNFLGGENLKDINGIIVNKYLSHDTNYKFVEFVLNEFIIYFPDEILSAKKYKGKITDIRNELYLTPYFLDQIYYIHDLDISFEYYSKHYGYED